MPSGTALSPHRTSARSAEGGHCSGGGDRRRTIVNADLDKHPAGLAGLRARAGDAASLDAALARCADRTRRHRSITPPMCSPCRPLLGVLGRYRPEDAAEAADVARVRALAETAADPWLRSIPLHVTASALVVHPDSGRVLLRWHQRQQAWLQVGGHADPGESDPLAIALREAREETGLPDLVPWPDAEVRHVVIVPVPAASREPAHEHADLRFFFATRTPDAARAERPDAPLRWLSPRDAHEATSEANVAEPFSRPEGP